MTHTCESEELPNYHNMLREGKQTSLELWAADNLFLDKVTSFWVLQTVRMFSVALDGIRELWNTVILQQTHKLLMLVWGQGGMRKGLWLTPVLLLGHSPSLFGICRSGWEGSCFVSKRVYAHEYPLSRCHSALGCLPPPAPAAQWCFKAGKFPPNLGWLCCQWK